VNYVLFGLKMEENIRNAKLERRINRRGGTLPFLVCVELNPGPHKKSARRCAKKPRVNVKIPKLTNFEKGKIAMGINNNLSRGEIRIQLGTGKKSVQLWADRYEKEGHMERKSGSGRPRITTQSDDRHLLVQCKRKRKRTAVDLRTEITNEDGQPKASVWTIRRRLVEAGYPARKARKKPLLTKEQKKARLKWAKDHKDWTVERWSKVLWSDESPFTLFPRAGHQYVRRQPGEELREDCVSPTVKHGGKWFGAVSMQVVLAS
jgi:transposase